MNDNIRIKYFPSFFMDDTLSDQAVKAKEIVNNFGRILDIFENSSGPSDNVIKLSLFLMRQNRKPLCSLSANPKRLHYACVANLNKEPSNSLPQNLNLRMRSLLIDDGDELYVPKTLKTSSPITWHKMKKYATILNFAINEPFTNFIESTNRFDASNRNSSSSTEMDTDIVSSTSDDNEAESAVKLSGNTESTKRFDAGNDSLAQDAMVAIPDSINYTEIEKKSNNDNSTINESINFAQGNIFNPIEIEDEVSTPPKRRKLRSNSAIDFQDFIRSPDKATYSDSSSKYTKESVSLNNSELMNTNPNELNQRKSPSPKNKNVIIYGSETPPETDSSTLSEKGSSSDEDDNSLPNITPTEPREDRHSKSEPSLTDNCTFESGFINTENNRFLLRLSILNFYVLYTLRNQVMSLVYSNFLSFQDDIKFLNFNVETIRQIVDAISSPEKQYFSQELNETANDVRTIVVILTEKLKKWSDATQRDINTLKKCYQKIKILNTRYGPLESADGKPLITIAALMVYQYEVKKQWKKMDDILMNEDCRRSASFLRQRPDFEELMTLFEKCLIMVGILQQR